MASLDNLRPLIYHEVQQQGSMLCAQHALNSLLQGNYFTAPDLSDLAHNLDVAEQSYDRSRGDGSTNMDDTGFFSVQVLESALNLWSLSLVRWRSEAMRRHQDEPHKQLAFILNQNQHWYTLRRFGLAEHGVWFNLDSSEPRPQWIGKTYLAIFLQQAEQDGYSVFAVTPIDQDTDLPRTQADEVATSLAELSSAQPASSSVPQKTTSNIELEDEDIELQAALQASLAHATSSTSGYLPRSGAYPAPHISTNRDFPGIQSDRGFAASSHSRSYVGGSNIPPNQDPYGNADVDPVTASLERNRIIMERMRREQEMALQERYEEEVERLDAPRQPGRHGTSEEVVDEDEHFRRAIEASLAGRPEQEYDDDVDSDSDDDYQPTPPVEPMHRVYDDDDAALQAALAASLETVPHGFTLPDGPRPQPIEQFIRPPPAPPAPPATSQPEQEIVETASETDDDTSRTESDAPKEEEALSLEEIRRRRLARFGG
ncbi:Josephin-domain-containing protein [Scleroderma citrinum]